MAEDSKTIILPDNQNSGWGGLPVSIPLTGLGFGNNYGYGGYGNGFFGGSGFFPGILGGILGGFFTASEAAAIAVIYCFVVACFVYKTIKLKDVPAILLKSAQGACIVLAVMTTANFLGYVLTLTRIPQLAAQAISAGMFLDAASAIVILTPVFLPACQAFGVDLIFFGVMLTVNLMIGVLTPPVGLNLYVVSSIAKIDILKLAKASIPFMIILVVVTLLMVLFPGIATFLPNVLA